MSHTVSFLNIVAWYKVLKLFWQVEHIVPGNNTEEFPDKRLMTNQQRNIAMHYEIPDKNVMPCHGTARESP